MIALEIYLRIEKDYVKEDVIPKSSVNVNRFFDGGFEFEYLQEINDIVSELYDFENKPLIINSRSLLESLDSFFRDRYKIDFTEDIFLIFVAYHPKSEVNEKGFCRINKKNNFFGCL